MKTAIVGGGLGGLCAAVTLAREGRTVVLVEHAELGGRARSPALGGRPVNLGAHALYRQGVAEAALRGLGVRWRSVPPPSAGAFAFDEGELWPLPTSPLGLATSGLLDGGRWRFLRAMLEVQRGAPATGLTLTEWVDRQRVTGRARRLLLALVRVGTYAEAPDQVAAGPLLRQVRRALSVGVRYLPDGWEALAAQLATQARERGVEFVRARVEAISADGTVTLHGAAPLHAERVISTLPVAEAARVTGAPGLRALAQSAVPVRAACLDVVLDGLPQPGRRFALGLDAPLYASVHFDDERGAQVQLMKYLAPGVPGAPAKAELEALLERLQPGWRGRVKGERFLPEMLVQSRAPLPCEAPGPVAVSERVVAAGDWTGPGLLLDGAVGSALAACARVGASDKLAA